MAEGAPNPAEAEAAAQEEQAAPTPPETPGVPETPENPPTQPPQPHFPQRRAGFWGRLGRVFNRENPEVDQTVQEHSQAVQEGNAQEEQLRRQERETDIDQIETPKNPEEIVELMAQITAVQFRERQIQERYGRGWWGQARAFLGGERDYCLDENGEVHRQVWHELARKATISVFNKRNIVGLGVCGLAAVGVLSGVGAPAGGAVLGSIVGRGAAEAWHSLCSREQHLRGENVRLQYERWARLHAMAESTQEQGINDDERNQRVANLVDGFYQEDQNIVTREKEMLEDRAGWNRRRNFLQMAGGVLGLGAGIWHGFADLSREAATMHIQGLGDEAAARGLEQGLPEGFADQARQVFLKDGVWHYIYNSGQEAALADSMGATLVHGPGGQAAHALGESTSTVLWNMAKNLAPTAAKAGAVFAGMIFGAQWEGRQDAHAEENRVQQEKDLGRVSGEERRFMREQIPGVPQEGVEATQPAWEARFQERGKTNPAVGNVWVLEVGAAIPTILRVDRIDYQNGQVCGAILGPDMAVMAGQDGQPLENQPFQLDVLLNNGDIRQEYVNNFLGRFGANDRVRVGENVLLPDLRGQQLDPDVYQLVKIENRTDQVILRRQGQEDRVVSVMNLAFFGINRFQEGAQGGQAAQPERQEAILPPRNRMKFEVISHENLPQRAGFLSTEDWRNFVIENVDFERGLISIYSTQNREMTNTLFMADWATIYPRLAPRGEVTGGGQQQRQQRQGGGQGGQEGGRQQR